MAEAKKEVFMGTLSSILVGIVVSILFALVVFSLLKEELDRFCEIIGKAQRKGNRLKELLINHEQFIGGVVIVTDGISQKQSAGRVTDIELREDKEDHHMVIYTDIPRDKEAMRRRDSDIETWGFISRNVSFLEITLFYVGRIGEYRYLSNKERGTFTIFAIAHGRDPHLVTFVKKDTSEEFLKRRKEYCDNYAQNSLGDLW